MVWATSLPYAPTFWIGVPPTKPGMPDRASIPLHSCTTAVATRASQSSPAATVTVAPLQSETSALMPRVATRTTVPGNPLSATSRFDPPPSTSTGSPSASADRTASTSSVSVVAVTTARAGPPTRSVVSCARPPGAVGALVVGTVEVSDSEVTSQDSPAVTEMPVTTDPRERLSGTVDDRPGRTQHLDVAADRLDGDRHQGVVDGLDHAAEDELGAVGVVGHHDRLGEPDEVGPHAGRIPHPVGHHPQGAAHGQHPVSDHAGQTDLLGVEARVVDRVEVGRRTGVPDQGLAGEPDGETGQPGADRDLGQVDGTHASASWEWKKVA